MFNFNKEKLLEEILEWYSGGVLQPLDNGRVSICDYERVTEYPTIDDALIDWLPTLIEGDYTLVCNDGVPPTWREEVQFILGLAHSRVNKTMKG